MKNSGQFKKGERRSPATEFKSGQHWRPHQQFREKAYLEREYLERQRNPAEIAAEWGVTRNAIDFWLAKHGIPRRSIREVRAVKKWAAVGPANGMFGRRGAQSPSWRGGVTPERQAFYSTPEWTAARIAVRERDGEGCRRCGAKPYGRAGRRRFHLHHIVSFAVVSLRADPTNLVVLCTKCHRFVHSRANIAGEFIKKGGGALWW